jgi:hypothetical protein
LFGRKLGIAQVLATGETKFSQESIICFHGFQYTTDKVSRLLSDLVTEIDAVLSHTYWRKITNGSALTGYQLQSFSHWYKRPVVRSVGFHSPVKQVTDMRFSTFVSTAVFLQSTFSLPHFTQHGRDLIRRATSDYGNPFQVVLSGSLEEGSCRKIYSCNDGNQKARLFVNPEPLKDSSSKKIPGKFNYRA